jgi:hypothetical protein
VKRLGDLEVDRRLGCVIGFVRLLNGNRGEEGEGGGAD